MTQQSHIHTDKCTHVFAEVKTFVFYFFNSVDVKVTTSKWWASPELVPLFDIESRSNTAGPHDEAFFASLTFRQALSLSRNLNPKSLPDVFQLLSVVPGDIFLWKGYGPSSTVRETRWSYSGVSNERFIIPAFDGSVWLASSAWKLQPSRGSVIPTICYRGCARISTKEVLQCSVFYFAQRTCATD